MNLFEIKQEIESLIDYETGEIADYEAFAELQMSKQEKIENTIAFIKNLESDAEALKTQADAFAERYKAYKKKAENLKEYLDRFLEGEDFACTTGEIKHRKSSRVEINDEVSFMLYASSNPDFVIKAEPKPNKTAIKEAIKLGQTVPGCEIVETKTMSIK